MIKNNYKIAVLGLLMAGYSGTALGDCETISNYYTKCNSGYYLLGNEVCLACPNAIDIFYPNGSSVTATSPQDNTSGLTSCYIAAGEYRDETGFFTITDECHYSIKPPSPDKDPDEDDTPPPKPPKPPVEG